MNRTGKRDDMTIRTISILGCGWLGFPLAKELLTGGFIVKGSTTRSSKVPALKKAGIAPYLLVLGDGISDESRAFFQTDLLVLNVPPGRRRPNVAESHPNEIRKVLNFAFQAGVPHLIFVSSTSVYGRVDGLVTEETPTAPTTASGRALAKIESMIRSDFPGIDSTILRMAGLIGPQRNPATFLAGKTDLDRPQARVNLVTLQDAMQAIRAVIELSKWNTVYNVCAGEHPTRQDYYTQKSKAMGLQPPIFRGEPGNSGKIVDNTRAKQELKIKFSSLNDF